MSTHPWTRLFPALVGISLTSVATGVRAQEPAKSSLDDTTLEVIVVKGAQRPTGYVAKTSRSATKTGASVMETPQSVSVMTREQIQAQGGRTAQESLRYVAGVQAELRPNSRFDIVSMRGFDGNTSFIQYLDGLKMLKGISFSQPTIDLHDVERIEIIRGPSSVLYGQANPGGLVNLVSKKPTSEPVHQVELGLGSPLGAQAAFDFGGKVTDDETILYRLNGVASYAESNFEDANSKRVSISPAVTLTPDAGTSLTILGNYTYDPESYYPAYLPAAGIAYANGSYPKISRNFNVGDPNYENFTRKVARIGYEFEHAFDNGLTVRQNLRYAHIDTDLRGIVPRSMTGSTINRLATHTTEAADTFVADNQLQWDLETGAVSHTILAGVDYQWVKATRLYGAASIAGIDYTNPVYGAISTPAYTTDSAQTNRQLGFYLQDQVKWDNWSFMFGGRHDSYDLDLKAKTLATGATAITRQENSAFTGRAGLMYQFDNGIAPYASYSTSFEPPAGLGYSDAGGAVLDPVKAHQFEVGFKYEPTAWSGLITVAAFDLTQENATRSDSEHFGYYVQTDKVRSRGVELEAKANLSNGWDMTFAYTFTDAKITKSDTLAYSGNAAASIPQHAASLWAHYSVSSGALDGLGIGGGIRYQGSSYGDEANSFKVDGFAVFDAALDYDFGRAHGRLDGARLSVNVSNIFDKEYVSGCSSTTSCFYGTGRTVSAKLSYKW